MAVAFKARCGCVLSQQMSEPPIRPCEEAERLVAAMPQAAFADVQQYITHMKDAWLEAETAKREAINA
jgi:hypothetical protein